MAQKVPRGYLGIGHETRGSEIMTILETVRAPELTLGVEMVVWLKKLRPDGWYPIGLMLDLMETLEQKLGKYHLKQLGWTIFSRDHAPQLREHVRTAQEALQLCDAQYKTSNRGTSIGGWKVVSFTHARAELEKTTPHHCAMEEGILEEIMRTLGVVCTVSQSECIRAGGDICRFLIEPKVAGPSWM